MRRTIVATLTLLSLVLASSAPLHAQSGSGLIKLPGMKLGGTITRDANGIAQVWGISTWDMAFLNGYVHAQDRFFQMDVSRRTARGTLAELLGPSALSQDVQLRTIGLGRGADASTQVLSNEAFDLLDAYSKGVNAWLAANPLPPEYAALELTTVTPWAPADSVAVGKLIAFGLSFDLDTSNTQALLTYQAVGAAAGFDGVKLFYEDLFRSAPFAPHATLPGSTSAAEPEAATEEANAAATAAREALYASTRTRVQEMLEAGVLDVLKSYDAKLSEVPLLRAVADHDRDASSNVWVVAGRLTTTGNAMLANDPHLALDTPATWYPIALRSTEFNVSGNSFPGVPLIVHGQNANLAWGSTVNPMDVTDIYQETVVRNPTASTGYDSVYKGVRTPLGASLETFRANAPGNNVQNDVNVVPATGSIPPATLFIARTGLPIITPDTLASGTVISLQYAGQYATRELDAILRINRARSVGEFRDALQLFDVGSQNWMVASTNGDIAWFTSAELPLREDLQAGTVQGVPPWILRSGAGGNDWIPAPTRPADQALPFQILPFSEMPQSINPAQGWLANGNNDPNGITFTNNPLSRTRPGGGILYLNPGYDGYRGARIAQLIRQKLGPGNANKLSIADMKAIQADNVMIDAVTFLPFIATAYANGRAAGADPTLAALAANPIVGAIAQRLAAWDGSTPTGIKEGYDPGDDPRALPDPTASEISRSVAATLFAGWRSRMIANTVDGVLGSFPVPGGAPKPGGFETVSAIRNLLDTFPTRKGRGASGVPFFNVPVARPEDQRDIIILKSLADGLTMFSGADFATAFNRSQNLDDYRWGKLHRKTFNHPLGGAFSVPPAGIAAPLAGLPGIPRAGGFEVIDRSDSNPRGSTLNGFMFGSGPSKRYVAEATPAGILGQNSLPGGVSGVLGSPLYANLLPDWLVNRTYGVELQSSPVFPWR